MEPKWKKKKKITHKTSVKNGFAKCHIEIINVTLKVYISPYKKWFFVNILNGIAFTKGFTTN